MLIVMLGVGTGLKNGAFQEFNRIANNSIFFWPQATKKSYKGFPAGRRFTFNNGDVTALLNHVPEIKYLAPRIRIGGYHSGTNISRGLKTGAFNIYGDYPDVRNIHLIDMALGRFINRYDVDERRKVAVIGSKVYQTLFDAGEEAIGQYICIKDIYFKIVGVFKSRASGDSAEEDEQTVFLPLTTCQRLLNYGDRFDWLSIAARETADSSVVKDNVIEILSRRHMIAPDDRNAFGNFNTATLFRKIKNLFIGIDTLIWIVGCMTLISGVVGVSNIMLVIVKEQTREIGIKKAIGATPWDIISQIVMESLILTALPGYAGIVLGVGVLEVTNIIFIKRTGALGMFQNPGVDFSISMIALSMLIVSGILSGMIPARRAVEIKPTQAIKNG